MNLREAGGTNDGDGGAGGGTAVYGTAESTITSNFNGTSIASGSNIWFNAHFKIKGNINTNTIIKVNHGLISFSGITQPLPSSVITFSSVAAAPVYDAVNNVWNITASVSQKGNIFFTGLIFPSTGLPGGINPVNLGAVFSTNQPGISLQWQWSAAVFNTTMNYTDLNVVGADGSGNHAGAPLGYKGFAIGGARGGGASNLTGSWSATGNVTPKWN